MRLFAKTREIASTIHIPKMPLFLMPLLFNSIKSSTFSLILATFVFNSTCARLTEYEFNTYQSINFYQISIVSLVFKNLIKWKLLLNVQSVFVREFVQLITKLFGPFIVWQNHCQNDIFNYFQNIPLRWLHHSLKLNSYKFVWLWCSWNIHRCDEIWKSTKYC